MKPEDREKALEALTEMYAVLNDSDRWHGHMALIRAFLTEQAAPVDVEALRKEYASAECGLASAAVAKVNSYRTGWNHCLDFLASRDLLRTADAGWKFKRGDRVRKIGTKGQWHGHVVGFYSASCTERGYNVESEREIGSVQIYPESALELIAEVKK